MASVGGKSSFLGSVYTSLPSSRMCIVSRERCQGLIFASFVQLHWPELVYLIFFRCSRFWACGCLLGLRFSFFACCIVISALLVCIMACNASLYSCLSFIAKLIGYLFCFFYFTARVGQFVDRVPWWSGRSYLVSSCFIRTVFTAFLYCFGGLIWSRGVLFLLHTCMK